MNSADQMAVLVEMMNKGYYEMPGMINGSSGGPIAKMYSQLYNYDSVTNTYALKNTLKKEMRFCKNMRTQILIGLTRYLRTRSYRSIQ
ncbi:hypothetical protein LWM68_42720 [Niabella sp. W65]|nr:hypothetical protein [Niabella sp. W65]MCH7368860.1 hypothetical protein [Niabella sp. W65]ULT44426.1 hypothetical protein KRR40_14395 [Niabella sp. I65]